MACNIIEGFTLDCKTGAAGVFTLYLSAFQNISSTTTSSGTTTAITMAASTKFYEYQVRNETAEWKYNPTPNLENGTISHDSTVEFTIYKVNAKNINIIDLLTQNRLTCIVKFADSNTGMVLLGEGRGGDVTAAPGGSGKANGDLNGYKVTITFKEPNKPTIYSGSITSIT